MQHMKEVKKQCLKTLLNMYKEANAGHIGASLSCIDILIYLLFYKIKSEEDKIILSKGHAALALYITLSKSGRIPEHLLKTFYKEGTSLAAHPPCNNSIEAIPFGTGSLGHGLSLATGLAFSQKYTSKKYNVYCIISEGDCNEGSTWEAALFAAQHNIRNLTVIVDRNNLQGFGKSSDILNLEPLIDKFKSFGFETAVVENGNDFKSLHASFEEIDLHFSEKPRCIIAKTTKGSCVSYMENKMEWHYYPMSDEQYQQALKETEFDA